MDVRKIGAFISGLRKENNYTQAELAQLLNISHQAVSKWERGDSLPDIGLLPRTAKLLRVTVDELLYGARVHSEHNGEHRRFSAGPSTMSVASNPGEKSWEEDGDVLDDGKVFTYEHISSLAPFLSQETLEAMVEQAEGEADWANVTALAPFLGRTSLEKWIEGVVDGSLEPSHIVQMAPFLGHDALDRLVHRAEEGSFNWEIVSGLAPFLSRDTLSRLVRIVAKGSLEPEKIMDLAPFLPQKLLDQLVWNDKRN